MLLPLLPRVARSVLPPSCIRCIGSLIRGEGPVLDLRPPAPRLPWAPRCSGFQVRVLAECTAWDRRGLPGCTAGFLRCFQDLRFTVLSRQLRLLLLSLAEGPERMPPDSLTPPPVPSWVATRAWPSSQAPPSGSSHHSLGPLFRGRARSPHSDFFLSYRGRAASQLSTCARILALRLCRAGILPCRSVSISGPLSHPGTAMALSVTVS
ncbi:hypothetical protein NDU88_004408 [Pleurodeles waltl]|uniref:Secreted protein n=1 Tax=Pleurodeles waltl TaxID=8319 RepID=A0AAV7RI34_PLEWA|nr:hypothetical protein NDU88_004408 [Pleurodeles waltl]